jgi:hypothetical protein
LNTDLSSDWCYSGVDISIGIAISNTSIRNILDLKKIEKQRKLLSPSAHEKIDIHGEYIPIVMMM